MIIDDDGDDDDNNNNNINNNNDNNNKKMFGRIFSLFIYSFVLFCLAKMTNNSIFP